MSDPLLNDLDELISKEIISSETAAQIREYYENKKTHSSTRFTSILSILGALLLGTGIILVIAHNWDMLGKTTRTFIAFLPLVIGQALTFYAAQKKKYNRAWLESSSVILFFGVATCIALIGQIYQISGTLPGFLLVWMLVTLPLVYLMPSSVVSLLLIAVATWHGTLVGYGESAPKRIPYEYICIILLLLPNYLQYYKATIKSNFFHLHNWLMAISLSLMLGGYANKFTDTEWLFAAYITLAGLYYIIGYSKLMRNQRLFSNPFLIIGTFGIIFSFLIWSSEWLWRDEEPGSFFSILLINNPLTYITVAILIISGYLLVNRFRKEHNPTVYSGVDIVGLSPFAFVLGIVMFHNHLVAGIIFFNIWLLLLGLSFVRRGTARDHLGVMNFGLLVIAILAILRFFDTSIPFVWRGLFFIGTGIAFFVANSVLLKKRRLSKTNPA